MSKFQMEGTEPPVPPPYAPPPPSPTPQVPVLPKTSGLAIASLVLGVFWLYGLGSVLAVIFGSVALRNINRSNGWVTGKGMAIAGLVLGIIGLIVFAILIFGLTFGGTTESSSGP